MKGEKRKGHNSRRCKNRIEEREQEERKYKGMKMTKKEDRRGEEKRRQREKTGGEKERRLR